MGNLGAVLAVAVGDIPTYLVISYGLWKEGLFCFWQDIKLTALFLGVLGILLFCRFHFGHTLPIDRLLPIDWEPGKLF